jgi:AcrR family transcriptional regulator
MVGPRLDERNAHPTTFEGPRKVQGMAKRQRSRGDSGEVVVKRGVLNEARWDEILQAAANEFYEKGFKGARLQDIASRVGLLTGSLYYYIESKENLLFALVDTAFRKGLEATEEDPVIAASDPSVRLRTFVQRQMRVLEDAQSTALVVVERDREYLAPEHREQVDVMRAQVRNHVTAIIRAGITSGDFDATVDVEVATSSLFALMNTTSEWAQPGQGPWNDITDWYIRLFLRALMTPTSMMSTDGAGAVRGSG